MIPFGPYRPDIPVTDAQSNEHVKNVIPASGYYKPMNNFVAYSNALNNVCVGCIAMTDDEGNQYILAGDKNTTSISGTITGKLYSMSTGTATWNDVTNPLLDYNTPDDGQWRFTKYGQYAVATNFADEIQHMNIATESKFSTLVAELKCRFIEVIKNFLFVGNTWDNVDGYVPYRVRWSALGDHTDFTYSKATQADFQDLSGDGGWVQGIVGGLIGADGAIFMDRAIVRVTYVSGNTIFQFDNVEGGIGTQAPNSIVKAQGVAFFLGQDGFYMFDGINLIPIGKDKVDNTFFDDFDDSFYHRVWGAVDPTNTVIFWSYPSSSASSTANDKILAFDYVAREWSIIEHANELVVPSLTLGTDLDDITDVLGYTNLDTLPFSLDSRVWTGGGVKLAAFDSNHKFGYYDGVNMAAEIETIEVRLGNNRSMITEIWPVVDASSSYTITGSVTTTISTIAAIAIPRTRATQTTLTYTGTATLNSIGFFAVRSEGRFHRTRILIPEDTPWEKASGVDYIYFETGKR